jgi:hypothetical protein
LAAQSKKSKKSRTDPSRQGGGGEILLAAFLLSAVAMASAAWFVSQGDSLAFGDAEAHLNIARRIWDNRLPEYREIGTVWLPLPHLLMLPFTMVDSWYRNGVAGAIPASIAWVLAGLWLFSGVRRLADSSAPAFCAVAVFAGNPNLLYLASAPMTEPFFFAGLFALFRTLVAFCEQRSIGLLSLAVMCAWSVALTRYEGWVLIPVAAVMIGWRDVRYGAAFLALASLAPLYWLAHNWWLYGDALEFYGGEWSARAIYDRTHGSGFAAFPGEGHMGLAWVYLRTAAELALGQPLYWIALIGLLAVLAKRWFGYLVAFLVMPLLQLWGMYSGGGVEVFVPSLWPYSYYNSRYALSCLPLAALSAAALVSVLPALRARVAVAVLLAAAALAPWLAYPNASNWIVWKEGRVNSLERRRWTQEMAGILTTAYRPGDRIFYSFGDLTGALREAGIAQRATIHDGNELDWLRTLARPDLYLDAEWVLDFSDGKAALAAGKRFEVFARIPRGKASAVLLLRRKPAPLVISRQPLRRGEPSSSR